jgi:hypothetical protein
MSHIEQAIMFLEIKQSDPEHKPSTPYRVLVKNVCTSISIQPPVIVV